MPSPRGRRLAALNSAPAGCCGFVCSIAAVSAPCDISSAAIHPLPPMRAHFLALQALATTACLTDPAVSDNSFNLDECPSLIAALDVLNTGATDVMIDCEPSCSATFAKVCCRLLLSSEVAACCCFICFTCTSCSFSAPLARPSNSLPALLLLPLSLAAQHRLP